MIGIRTLTTVKARNATRTKKAAGLASPFATGGGGHNFETRVQSAFAVLMLTGGFAPCIPPWPIAKVKLQGRYAGYETDDLIVFSKEPGSDREARLLAQVKHSVRITAQDPTLTEVIRAAWTDFNNPKVFRRHSDHLALVTGPLTATDMEVREVLEWAREAENAGDFLTKVRLAKFSSDVKRAKLGALQRQLEAANGGPLPDELVWEFLKRYHVLCFDVDVQSGVVQCLLHALIAQFQPDGATGIWARVVDLVQAADQNAGTITPGTIPEDLLVCFEKRGAKAIPTDLVKATTAASAPAAFNGPSATIIAKAMLVGGWEDAAEGDLTIVAKVTGAEATQWTETARVALQEPESPLDLHNGTWSVGCRGEVWERLGPRILDADLERFREAAINVLAQPDPAFDLQPEDRYLARVKGKVASHSGPLRKGMADTLALLGSRPEHLTHCTRGKPETIAFLVVRDVLADADWPRWGSLDSLLPLLAEAAPRAFLDAVEGALSRSPCPFAKLFEQEGKGILGGNYLTGLLWALESLAWDAELLSRVTVILGALAAIDPGGTWANRPGNSLATIFLPWLPQTIAPPDKRHVAVETLRKEQPRSAWKLVLGLMPSCGQMSMGGHKPVWRRTIPEGWDGTVTTKQYMEDVSFYADLALKMAKAEPDNLPALLESMDNLPPAAAEGLLAHVESCGASAMTGEQRLRIWSVMTDLVLRHRRFPNESRANEPAFLDRIERASQALAPTDPIDLHRHLFSRRDFDLYESSDDWDEQAKRLAQRRNDAVGAVLAWGGIEAVMQLASKAESPDYVGVALGAVAPPDIDAFLLPAFLTGQDVTRDRLVAGYIWSRLRTKGWAWVDGLPKSDWTSAQVGRFLACLPFCGEVWRRSTALLGISEGEYWSRAVANPYASDEDMRFAAEKLIRHGRYGDAVECLHGEWRRTKALDHKLAIEALLSTARTIENPSTLRVHEAMALIKALQDDPTTDPKAMCEVEWAYIPLLDDHRGMSPKTLERHLASDPEAFCEVIRFVFRSKGDAAPRKDPTEWEKNAAVNVYRLLHSWRIAPGTSNEGGFSGEQFSAWMASVSASCTASGHLEVAQQQIGQVLTHAPTDPSGLWICREVAEALNAVDAENMRRGFCIALHNQRGVHWVDPTGAPEKELAEKHRRQADEVERAGYHRLADSLRQLAASYDREAERIIEEHVSAHIQSDP